MADNLPRSHIAPSYGKTRLVAITRGVSERIGRCELTYSPRVKIDLDLARAQHRIYERTLAECGCEVVSLPADSELPDSVFVEDTAIVLDEVAIIARPGVESRRPETASVARELGEYRKLEFIDSPGTLEGGDVLCVGKTLYAGLSGRTNETGIDQLRARVLPHGYTVTPVKLTACLHLKSAATEVGPETLLVNPRWVDKAAFGRANLVEVDPDEPLGANGLLVGTIVIYPSSFTRTRRRLEEHGIHVAPVDVSELQKAEGAVTCCSLVFGVRPRAR